ncbi:hypothetical protein [Anaeromusa sp.]|uniref:hypothetical protein n=1 Tax=Anaeromusa sp. TaxID=1872520 RepID=UPI002B20C720|nr:hypothetical protein [Anaeromusa sp.]
MKKSLRTLHEHTALPGKNIWYEDWKQGLAKYDTVIIFDGIRGGDVVEYIHEHNPKARIIIYYVNKFRRSARNNPQNFKALPCELWSFDQGDCAREGMKHNVFCYDHVFLDARNKEAFEASRLSKVTAYDAFFIGVDKSRLDRLLALQQLLCQQNYTTKFILRKAARGSYANLSPQAKEILVDQDIVYSEIINYISQSKCIVELQDPGQSGLTLRAMEALFFRKKLLTDNPEIRNCEFYRQENIFIWGQDEERRLADFLHTPYQEVPAEVSLRYTWEAWLDRFFAGAM